MAGPVDPVLASVINEVDAPWRCLPRLRVAGNGTLTATYDSSGKSGSMMNQMFSGGFCCRRTGHPATSRHDRQNTHLDSNGNLVDILYFVSAGATGATGSTGKYVLLNTNSSSPVLTIRDALIHAPDSDGPAFLRTPAFFFDGSPPDHLRTQRSRSKSRYTFVTIWLWSGGQPPHSPVRGM